MKKFLLSTVLAGTSLLSTQVSQAQTAIYREIFANLNTANSLPASDSWVGSWSSTALDSQAPGGGATSFFGISSSNGNSTGVGTPINTTPAEVNTNRGFLFISGGVGNPGATNWVATTSAFTVNTGANTVNDMSFYSGNSFTASLEHFVVQIDGNWYATVQTFGNAAAVSSAANFAAQAQQDTFTWTTAASAWETLNYTPGTTLTLGSVLSSALPGDNITAFGLYSDGVGGTGGTTRVDTFQIDATAVPEPSSIALVLSGVGILMGFRRSRKA
jgi:PEP-CTERM motif